MELVVYGALCREGEERELARRLLRLALERERGLGGLPAMEREAGGKPYFPSRPDLCFNLSHSHGAAVCALHDKRVGVDVERRREAPRHVAAGMTEEAFFRLWTAREATAKREGRGLAALLAPLEPDSLCRCREDFLPDWVVTVCSSEAADIRWVRVADWRQADAHK